MTHAHAHPTIGPLINQLSERIEASAAKQQGGEVYPAAVVRQVAERATETATREGDVCLMALVQLVHEKLQRSEAMQQPVAMSNVAMEALLGLALRAEPPLIDRQSIT